MPFTFMKQSPEKLKSKLQKRFGVKALVDSQSDVQAWFDSNLGQRLLAAEQASLNKIMPEMYGYHLMNLSPLEDASALSELSPVTHHFCLGVSPQSQQPAVGEFESLPLDSECIDVALLHHVLEFSTNPHQLLREAARTVIPNGYIIVVGFNPSSVLTLSKQVSRLVSDKAQNRYNAKRRSRIIDWLRLLDFEPAHVEYGTHSLPLNSVLGKRLDDMLNKTLPVMGSFYTIVARKSTMSLNVIKPEWKKTAMLPSWAKASSVRQASNEAHKKLRLVHSRGVKTPLNK